ncbi:DUF748 domain-containing protein [Zeimonas arvi]|uniref:DUF748 domain-containing protein n=1 Tax=Zeimonas arvi TaxID=2498847 RepID=A0A5C8P663_9BURK|nr:DUF748 domain-containing protein [Zeimonas arvi]TXL68745.1 DUF748 domain-containing protein [Zeimonas arvi]
MAAPPDGKPGPAAAPASPVGEGASSAEPPAAPARRGWLRSRWFRALAIVVALVALWGIVLRFVAPGLLRDAIASQLAELTGRPASVERIEIEPYALVFRLHGLTVGEQSDGSAGGPARSHARLALLEADLSWRSLRRLAPVLERLKLAEPAVFVARDAEGVYDGADIVERLGARGPEAPQEDAGPFRFSVANIELSGGSVGLDDRKLDARHAVTDIGLRVPFASSLPVDQAIEVEPGFEATLDGAPIRARGRMLPFAAEPTGELQVSLQSFDLTRLLPHLPEPLPVKLVSAELASELTLGFRAPESAPAAVTVRGSGSLGGVELRQPDDRPLLKLPAAEATGIDFDLIASRLSIDRLAVSRPEIAIGRRSGEARFLDPVLSALERRAAQGATAADGSGFAWSIATIAIDHGRLAFDDQAFTPQPLRVALAPFDIALDGFGLPQQQPAQLKFSGRTADGEVLAANAKLSIAPFAMDGEASLDEISVARWAWLAGPALALKVREGKLAVSTRYRVRSGQATEGGGNAGAKPEAGASQAEAIGWQLNDGRLRVDSLVLADAAREVARIGKLEVQGVGVDPGKRRVTLDSALLDGGKLALRRDARGALDAAGWWRDGGAGEAGRSASAGSADAGRQGRGAARDGRDDAAWQATIGKLAVTGAEVELAYAPAGGQRHPPLRLGGIAIEAQGLATDGTSPVPVSVAVRVDKGGRLSARGTVVPTTGALALALQARALPIPAAQAWLPPAVNANLVSGALSADGKLQLDFGADGAPRGQWQGAVSVADLNARLKGEAAAAIPAEMVREGADPADLLGWKSLRLSSTRVTLSPLFVDLGDIEIDGLRSRLVIQPNGRFNLQDVVDREGGGAPGGDAPGAAAAGGTAAAGDAPRADDGPPMGGADAAPARSAALPKTDPPPLRIGRIQVADSNIDFSDYFIKPNYSANLTGLRGSVGEMRAGQPAELSLDGRIDNTGSVKIAGRIDPIGEPLFLDVRADAHDIDLPALSPYSGKYVGYGIQKGKLSASVEYRVESGQLTAQNKIVLDQLSFGEPVDSPDALKLPVLFAVSLLKDRNGVIDVQLPISGSLDDPQFSVAGIVLRIIGNLIVKAVTAPFSLIAGLVGGAGEELSTLDFAPADVALGDKARERLGSLAKALAERPGLKLDIAGRATAVDRMAMQQAQLEARLKRIRKALDGTDEKQPITETQRPVLLAQAWLMGRVPAPAEKDRPPAYRMQQELVAAVALPDGALRELANRRAQAAKDWLAGAGKVDPGRLFVTAPTSTGEAEDRPAVGVEMTLK